MTRACTDCGNPISVYSKGRCRPCVARALSADRDIVARRNEKTRITRLQPESKARHAEATAAAKHRLMEDPDHVAMMRRTGLEAGQRNFWRHGDEASKVIVRANMRKTMLAWCPEPYWPLNAELKRAGIPLSERKRIVAETAESDERKRLAAMTSLERQLERVRNGAKLIEVRPLRRADPSFTLGGVAPEAI